MRWIWIDRFVEFVPGKKATAIKNVSLAEEHVHDHWEAFPIHPASLMIEGMAQTAGILVGQARDFKEKVILAKIAKAEFDDIVCPGDQVAYQAEIDNVSPEAASTRGIVLKNGKPIGRVDLMFSHIDQNMAGVAFPEENFVFTGQFERLVAPFLEGGNAWRVAVTGLGVVCATGIGAESFYSALLEGRGGVTAIAGFDASTFPSRIAGEIKDFSARDFVPKSYRKSVKVMARDIEIAVAAADLAVRDSGLVTRGIDENATTIEATRLGCNIGAGLICSDLDELGSAINTAVTDGKFDIRKWGSGGMGNLTPLWLLKYLPNMLSCHVTIIHGAEGPSNTITCSDASAHLAVGEAARMIARGSADAIIAGGAESKLNPMGLLRQGLLGRLCTSGNDSPASACRPFDTGHCGTVMGEGGGLLVLEDYDRATQRGAKIYAELVGFGAACDPMGMDVTRPTAGGLGLAAAKAMADAGITADQVDLVVAHGTGVPAEDRCECEAWQEALGAAATRIPAVAVTGSTGSAFAGAGGVELGVAAMAIRTQSIPPTLNFTGCESGCGLQFSAEARKKDIRYVITGAFSIGGQSAACVLRRAEA